MKFTKLDLLTLLISLFLFASCENSNTIGLELDPSTQISGKLVDTLTVLTKTIPDDVVSTWASTSSETNLLRHPFGYLVDPILGTSEASLAMSVNLPSSAYRFGTNAILDSAVLVLPYSTQFYGDTTTSVYSVDVHQLNTDISMATNFKSNVEWPYSSALIGNYTAKIKPTTPVRVTMIVSGAADTVKSVIPQMRIKLNTAFIQANIVNLDTNKLANSPTFTSVFKGLHVSINKTNSTGTGGIMFFNLSEASTTPDENSRVELYYKRQNATTTTAIDTVSSGFPISYSTNPVAATIKRTYTTAVTTQLADASNNQYAVTYLQGLGGLRNKISFPYLKNFYANFTAGSTTKIIINKAELVVGLSSGTDVSPFTPAPRLALYRYDIAGRRANLSDNSSADPRATSFGGYYDITNKNYVFVVTGYLQDLLDGKTIDYGTYLATSSSSEFDLTTPITSAARSIIGSSANATNKIRLNVYYTIVK